MRLIPASERPSLARPMPKYPRHKKPRHTNVKHATLASHDVNVVAPHPRHCRSKGQQIPPGKTPVRNDKTLRDRTDGTQRHPSHAPCAKALSFRRASEARQEESAARASATQLMWGQPSSAVQAAQGVSGRSRATKPGKRRTAPRLLPGRPPQKPARTWKSGASAPRKAREGHGSAVPLNAQKDQGSSP
jgi:hypothetical protein